MTYYFSYLPDGTPHLTGVCWVIIEVIDTNNHVPSFVKSSYSTSVQENLPIGTHVLTVSSAEGVALSLWAAYNSRGKLDFNIQLPLFGILQLETYSSFVNAQNLFD